MTSESIYFRFSWISLLLLINLAPEAYALCSYYITLVHSPEVFNCSEISLLQLPPYTTTVGSMDTSNGWTQSYEVGVPDGFQCQGSFTVSATLEPSVGAGLFSLRDVFVLPTGMTTITDTFLDVTPATLTPQIVTVVSSHLYPSLSSVYGHHKYCRAE